MGKTKTKFIDDAAEMAKSEASKANGAVDIVNDLEGVTAERAPVNSPAASETSEDGRRDTEPAGPQPAKKVKTSKAKQKVGKPKYRSKKYQEQVVKVDKVKRYPILEAVTLAQEVSYTKFPATIEAHINTSVKNLRGLVSLPHLAGKKLTILAFGKDAKEADADIVGDESTIAEIEKGKLGFDSGSTGVDVVVSTPEWMPKLAKAAKILGPKGLMPNPKNGTVSDNLVKAITELRGGKTEYKAENQQSFIIHLGIGKVDQPAEEIVANAKVLYNSIGRSKIKKLVLSPTMGPGVKVELSSLGK